MRLINVDLDGVVYDFHSAIHSVAEEYLAQNLPEPDTWSWHMWEDWGLDLHKWVQLFRWAVIHRSVFDIGQPVPGAIEALDALKDDGWTIRFVTNKCFPTEDLLSYVAKQQAIHWLWSYGLTEHQLAFSADKSRFDADVIIDDHPHLEWRQEGKHNILFGRPWNQNVVLPKDTVKKGCWDTSLEFIDDLNTELSWP